MKKKAESVIAKMKSGDLELNTDRMSATLLDESLSELKCEFYDIQCVYIDVSESDILCLSKSDIFRILDLIEEANELFEEQPTSAKKVIIDKRKMLDYSLIDKKKKKIKANGLNIKRFAYKENGDTYMKNSATMTDLFLNDFSIEYHSDNCATIPLFSFTKQYIKLSKLSLLELSSLISYYEESEENYDSCESDKV